MKPTTYDDWRGVYRRTIQAFGYSSFVRERCRPMPAAIRQAQIRTWWRLFDRLRRIRDRLDAARETDPAGFATAILEVTEGGDR